MTIRVVVIEDQELCRLGIRTAIAQESDMELCGEASCGLEGLELVNSTNPDIVLLDIGLPDINGLEMITRIKKHTLSKVIILSAYSSQNMINEAFACGADSYFLKTTKIDSIKNAIRSIYQNEEYLDQAIIKRFLEANHRQTTKIKGKRYNELPTTQEIEILKLIASGYSNKEIANQLFISISTVKSHAGNLFLKLGARDRVNAIIKAQSLGYLEPLAQDWRATG
ncbi:Two Component Transcriptional Regulator [Nostoc sphaeroides CCNUC1]|uniref:Two Component Transcriptional Regulator n=2 Tax=Nostoc sphaeroides TaxID=446679 RepID=A0A5P8WIH2_9NOSO|nr:Two Component Transcriptional Regulator [Nostoc sphaeroides CCNUC1]